MEVLLTWKLGMLCVSIYNANRASSKLCIWLLLTLLLKCPGRDISPSRNSSMQFPVHSSFHIVLWFAKVWTAKAFMATMDAHICCGRSCNDCGAAPPYKYLMITECMQVSTAHMESFPMTISPARPDMSFHLCWSCCLVANVARAGGRWERSEVATCEATPTRWPARCPGVFPLLNAYMHVYL